MEQAIATYREEASELLAELETSLLELEDTPDDNDLINRVFRAMHTIKGSGAMFGFDDIAAFTHEVETVFDMVRNGKMTVTKQLLDLTLKSRDHILTLLDSSAGRGDVDRGIGDDIINNLRRLLPQSDSRQETEPEIAQTLREDEPANEKTWRIRFRPNRELLLHGSNPISLLNELRGLGTCHVIAQLDEIPLLNDMFCEQCYIYWDIILTSSRGEDSIRDVFIFVEDDSDIKIELIDNSGDIDREDGYKKLGYILVERGDISIEEMRQALSQQKRFGELLVEQGLVAPEKVQSALVEQQHVKAVRQERSTVPQPEKRGQHPRPRRKARSARKSGRRNGHRSGSSLPSLPGR